MTRLCLALVALAALAAVATAAEPPRKLRIGEDPAPPAPAPKQSCLSINDKDACLDAACGWCEAGLVQAAQCLDSAVARLVPSLLADCSLPTADADDDDDEDDDDADDAELLGRKGKKHGGCDKKHKKKKHDDDKQKPPATCADNKEKHACLHLGADEGECHWCSGGFMPDGCMAAAAAKYLPPMVATCKAPKKHKGGDKEEAATLLLLEAGTVGADPDPPAPPPPPKKPTSCGDHATKKGCLDVGAEEGDCSWCKGDWFEACVSVDAASLMPGTVATCKMPSHKEDDNGGGQQPEQPEQDDDDADDDDERGLVVVNADTAENKKRHGKKDKPAPPARCADNKEKRACLRLGADEGDCAWCAMAYGPGDGECMAATAAKYLPETVASCKAGKKAERVAAALTAFAERAVASGLERRHKKHDSDKKKKHDDDKGGDSPWGPYVPGGGGGWGPPGSGGDSKGKGKHGKKGGGGKDAPGGGGWIPGGGSSSGGYGPGGGSWGPPGSGGSSGGGKKGGSCMDAKKRHDCLHSKAEGGCGWCKMAFGPGAGGGGAPGGGGAGSASCLPAMQAKFLPKVVADCEWGKGVKADAPAAE